MDLDFVRIECDITTKNSSRLAVELFNSLRSFQSLFKSLCCPVVTMSCVSCDRRYDCPYRIVFNQELSSNPEIVRVHQKPSLPFSFYISGMDDSSSTATVGIVVVGSAVHHIQLFYIAVCGLIETVVNAADYCAGCSVTSYFVDYQDNRTEIVTPDQVLSTVLLLSGSSVFNSTVHQDQITLILLSPLRLIDNGSTVRRFDFGSFFRSQLRRCSSLIAYYGAGDLDLDYARLSTAAQSVALFDDTLQYAVHHVQGRLYRTGLTGRIECAGLVEPMRAVLQLGSYFNAGKGATFGFGQYRIEVS